VLALHAGKFGERWAALARHHGYEVKEMALAWGEAVDASQVADSLRNHPDVTAVLAVHSETSTGTLHDIQAIAKAVRDTVPDALLLVDCVSSLSVAELRPREWQLDGIFSCSQKGFMSPPGLSVAWLSERAWESGAKLKTGYYLDLRKERISQRDGQCAYTPAVNLFYALEVALEMLLAEGIETVWYRRANHNLAVLEGAEAIGCRRFAARVSPAVAALHAPEKIMAPAIVQGFAARGVRISAGQDHTRDVLFRPSVLGYADAYDAVLLVAVLEDVLRELGWEVQHGVGVAAAMRKLDSSV
jgi:aspartate aminotransferase-like enzyme